MSQSGSNYKVGHSNSISARTSNLGSATAVPIIRYDAQGHITYGSTATIYPPTTVGTSNQYWRSDGSGAGTWTTPSSSPSSGSSTLISSGAVYTALRNKADADDVITGGTFSNGTLTLTKSSGDIAVEGFPSSSGKQLVTSGDVSQYFSYYNDDDGNGVIDVIQEFDIEYLYIVNTKIQYSTRTTVSKMSFYTPTDNSPSASVGQASLLNDYRCYISVSRDTVRGVYVGNTFADIIYTSIWDGDGFNAYRLYA